jgi:hypothetical protein
MPAVYPVSVRSFVPRVDNVDTIFAAHVNDLQNEMAAVESTLGANPHKYPGWFGDGNITWPPVSNLNLRTQAPVKNFGAVSAYSSVASRLNQMQLQVSWLTFMTQLLIGESGTKWKPPSCVIRAPGQKVPAGEGAWDPFQWGAADYDSDKMFQGGTTVVAPVSGFWDVSVNVWADSTVRRANDLHFVHVRMMRGYDEIAGQDSLIETQTWIRHRINLSWQGRWNAGIPMRVEISQHGASDNTVDANATISCSFVRDYS